MESLRMRVINGLKAGDKFRVKRKFTQEMVKIFSDISLDYNPVHCDLEFAKQKGFPSLICHGLLVGSMISEIGGQIAWLASELSFRFLKPVFVGDEITCEVTILEIDKRNRASAHAVFINQNGVCVFESKLKGVLPNENEKKLLDNMVSRSNETNKCRKI